jgi:hypothetical protein
VWLAMSPPNPSSYRDEHLFVDLRQQVVMLDGEALTLTPMQYCPSGDAQNRPMRDG